MFSRLVLLHLLVYCCQRSYCFQRTPALPRPSLSLFAQPNNGNDAIDDFKLIHTQDSARIGKKNWGCYTFAIVGLPLASLVFPLLLQSVTNLTLPVRDRQTYTIALLLYKRIYLYAIAVVTLLIASNRASIESPFLGKRLQDLTEEVIYGTVEGEESVIEQRRKERDENFYRSVDDVSEETQALLLPVLLSSGLFASFLFLTLQLSANSGLIESATTTDNSVVQLIQSGLVSIVPLFSKVTNTIVSFLFTRTEIRYLLRDDRTEPVPALPVVADNTKASEVNAINCQNEQNGDNGDRGGRGGSSVLSGTGADSSSSLRSISTALAAILVLIAYALPPGAAITLSSLPPTTAVSIPMWPIHNLVNMCIAVTTARAIQLPRLRPVSTALAGLTLYDAIGTGTIFPSLFGSLQQRIGGSTGGTTDGVASVMEAVARAKLATTAATGGAAGAVATNAVAGDVSGGLGGALAAVQSFFSSGAGGGWVPGLFEVSLLPSKVSDALGLADVVFPSLLLTWAISYQQQQTQGSSAAAATNSNDNGENSNKSSGKCHGENTAAPPMVGRRMVPLLSAPAACIGGYIVGCVMCEAFQTGRGQPALLFIAPSMGIALVLYAALQSLSLALSSSLSPSLSLSLSQLGDRAEEEEEEGGPAVTDTSNTNMADTTSTMTNEFESMWSFDASASASASTGKR